MQMFTTTRCSITVDRQASHHLPIFFARFPLQGGFQFIPQVQRHCLGWSLQIAYMLRKKLFREPRMYHSMDSPSRPSRKNKFIFYILYF